MDFILQGIAGSDPGAGQARASSQKADALASAAGAFRSLVDVLANGADAPKGEGASGTTSEAVPHDGFANLTDDNTAPVESPDAATNTTAASAHAAFNAAWAGAPSSAVAEEGDGSGAGDGSRPAGDDTRAAGTSQKSSSKSEDAGVVVAVWIADVSTPTAIGATNGQGTAAHDDAGDVNDDSADTHLRFAATAATENSLAGRGTDQSSAGDRTAAAFEAALDDAAQATRDVAAKDLVAAMGAARAAQLAARQAATSSDTANAASDAARASSQTNTLASLVKAATTARGEAGHPSAPTAVVLPHLMTAGGSTSFSSLMTGLSNGAPTSNTNALPDTTAAQIVQTLRLTAMGDGGEARITLDPAQFGELSVSIRVEQGQVVARMEAESPVVREWLQANQHLLRQQLADQNLTLNRLEVSEPSDANSAPRDRRESADGQSSQDARPRRRPRETESDERFEVVA